MQDRYITWHEATMFALGETVYAYRTEAPTHDEFIETFEAFYDETIADNRITSFPFDPPGSRRVAIGRASVVWADDFSDRDGE